MKRNEPMNSPDSSREELQRRQSYLDGLRRYQEKGIPIVIDGKVCDETEWEKIFMVQEDGFYMADYYMEEEEGGQKLLQIRFDKVYHD